MSDPNPYRHPYRHPYRQAKPIDSTTCWIASSSSASVSANARNATAMLELRTEACAIARSLDVIDDG